MTEGLEGLSARFFGTVGLVAPAGYHTLEVLLEEDIRSRFGGRDHLLLAFSPDAAKENPDSELLTYGSPLLDTIVDVASARGNTAHLYLRDLRASTGRTLEKVKSHTRLPGHIVEVGEEQGFLYHHALFRFKVSLIGNEREEVFHDVAVDLHTGWAAPGPGEQILRFYASSEPMVCREIRASLSLSDACMIALERLKRTLETQVKAHEDDLKASCRIEMKQVAEHYHAIVARLEAGKARKGTNIDRLDDKIRATQEDRERRLKDVDKRYQLRMELALTQVSLVSYLKTTVPVRLQQGKETKLGLAIWDSLVHEGYFAIL